MSRSRSPPTVVNLPSSPPSHDIWGDTTTRKDFFFHRDLGRDSEDYGSYSEGYNDYAEGCDGYADSAEGYDGSAWNSGCDAENIEESDSDKEEHSEPCYEDEMCSPYPHSDKFWFEDGNIVIQVNDTLYKLYRGILIKQSDYLARMISEYLEIRTFLGERASKSGLPLWLYNLSNYEFELLLSYMFPEDYSSQNDFTALEWATIADTASRLEIKTVWAAAKANVMKVAGPFDLIDLGQSHLLHGCVIEGLRQLCVREESLSLEEGERLGLKTVIAIAHGRDLLSRGSKWHDVVERVVTVYYQVSAKSTQEQNGQGFWY